MKYIITEDQYSKFIKVEPHVVKTIQKYLNSKIKNSKRVVTPKERNYDNIGIDFCKNNKVFMNIQYYFDWEEIEGNFKEGTMTIDREIVEEIINMFKLRKITILNLISEWYVENYLESDKLEFGDSNLEIDDILIDNIYYTCPKEVDTSNLSRQEMLDYIYKHTLYSHPEKDHLTDKQLEDLYIEIMHIQQRKEDLGF